MGIFEFKIDAEITHMFFIKAPNKYIPQENDILDEDDIKIIEKGENYLKKNYLYITTNNKITYKNLGVKKKSTSAIVKKMWNEHLIPLILKEKTIKFDKKYLQELMNKLLNEDLMLAAIRYNVNPAETYKSLSQLQAQISHRYGPGIHFLIPNKRYGVGKSKRYCTVNEFKDKKLSIKDLELDNAWAELNYFIKEIPVNTLLNYS